MKSNEVLSMLGISRVTLCRYVKLGKIRTIELPNGYYSYNKEDVYKLKGLDVKRKKVIYARVSLSKQKKELEKQIENITAYVNKNGYGIDEVYSDIASGMNLDRKGFSNLLSAVMANEIDEVFISYKDRLTLLDFDLVTRLFAQYGTRINAINSSENKSAEEELFEDLMSIIHSFSMNAYSKRRLAKKLLGEEYANNA
jgi:putative transposase orfA